MSIPLRYQEEHLTALITLLKSRKEGWAEVLDRPKEEIKRLYRGYSRQFYKNGIERFRALGEGRFAEAFEELLDEAEESSG